MMVYFVNVIDIIDIKEYSGKKIRESESLRRKKTIRSIYS